MFESGEVCNIIYGFFHSLLLLSSSLDTSGRPSPTARDLFQRVVPLIRWDGEIREVAVTALGLVNPPAFGYITSNHSPHLPKLCVLVAQ